MYHIYLLMGFQITESLLYEFKIFLYMQIEVINLVQIQISRPWMDNLLLMSVIGVFGFFNNDSVIRTILSDKSLTQLSIFHLYTMEGKKGTCNKNW